MKRFIQLLMLAILVLSLSGCSAFMRGFMEGVQGSTSSAASNPVQSQIVKSDDGKVSLSIPSDWKKPEGEFNSDADLFVTNEAKEQYIMVISESKLDFADDFDLDQYFDIIKDNMTQGITNAKWTVEEDTTVDGNPALYMEVNGTVENIKLNYFLKLVSTDKSYTQVMGWTLLSKTDANRDIINNVMDTFKEIA